MSTTSPDCSASVTAPTSAPIRTQALAASTRSPSAAATTSSAVRAASLTSSSLRANVRATASGTGIGSCGDAPSRVCVVRANSSSATGYRPRAVCSRATALG